MTYDERTLILDREDIIVFYSDGIVDAQKRNGEFFGAGRVAAIVSENTALPPTASPTNTSRKRIRFQAGSIPPTIARCWC